MSLVISHSHLDLIALACTEQVIGEQQLRQRQGVAMTRPGIGILTQHRW